MIWLTRMGPMRAQCRFGSCQEGTSLSIVPQHRSARRRSNHRQNRSCAAGKRVLLAVLAFAASFSASAEVSVTPDVVYGHKDGMALIYDVFTPAEAHGAAVLYMVSGGWFSRWQPPERRMARLGHLLDAGFTVFTIQHGSAPRFKVPDAVADVRRAVRHVRMHAERFGDRSGPSRRPRRQRRRTPFADAGPCERSGRCGCGGPGVA